MEGEAKQTSSVGEDGRDKCKRHLGVERKIWKRKNNTAQEKKGPVTQWPL